MARKTRRRYRFQGADPEAQSDDEGVHDKLTTFLVLSVHQSLQGVGQLAVHEMRTLTSGREGESSGVTGSNVLFGEADCEAQAGSSTRSQAQPLKDGPSNSGEYIAILLS